MKEIKQIQTIAEFFGEEKFQIEMYWREGKKDTNVYVAGFEHAGYRIEIEDVWSMKEEDVYLKRVIRGKRISGSERCGRETSGIRIGLRIDMEKQPEKTWRFLVPSMIYTKPSPCGKEEKFTFMEDRLTAPMSLAYCEETGDYYYLSKAAPSRLAEPARRQKGESRYLQKTHNVSIGYGTRKDGSFYFDTFWPYGEEDKSSALSADERPAIAYYPLEEEEFVVEMAYCIEMGNQPSFAMAAYEAYERNAVRMETLGEKVVELPFDKEDSREYRMHSLGKSYREFEEDGAGFFFHFDPLYGYGSRPSGFSTCYDTIPHNSYIHILEYGFTGRQINAAYIMASEKGGEWIERGEKVADFFIKHCLLENGWVYSLYDLNTQAPFFSFGDENAPKLHYISRTNEKGNYLRTMTEPMNDLLECYLWYKEHGRIHENWKKSVLKYADFLVRYQNEDGSWYRAYCPDGTGTDAIDRGNREDPEVIKSQKSVTSIPLVFFSNLCEMLKVELCGDRDSQEKAWYQQRLEEYLSAAKKAGDYVLADMVREEHYQGATLDNPNQVDKEAAQYVMAGLCRLYLLTKEEKYLSGAENAAFIFTTWNYIWNAPMQKNTILYEKSFQTKGMGAINSVWGGGVVDIYSLFHIRELYLVGRLKGHPLMCRMAEWIATATAQILSTPEDDMGFADIGMQPEGFGICPQGMDEGMIEKGGIWGTLGWIYSAGIYGLKNYLQQKEEM